MSVCEAWRGGTRHGPLNSRKSVLRGFVVTIPFVIKLAPHLNTRI